MASREKELSALPQTSDAPREPTVGTAADA